MKLNAKQLRTTSCVPEEVFKIKRYPIYIIVDNVLDTYNIGSIFRLADAVAAQEVILCGESLTPPHTRIKKASVNTTEFVPWRYEKTAEMAVKSLKLKVQSQIPDGTQQSDTLKLKVVAIEQDKRSKPYTEIDWSFPLTLVVGNESYGVSKKVLKMADEIAELPMWGINKSLNCMVSLGIVLYRAMGELESEGVKERESKRL